MTRGLRLRVVLFLAASLIAGCAAKPPPGPTIPPAPPPLKATVVQASFEAAANVNPDSNGRASPVVVHFFELKSPAAFEGADFFSLFEREKETLGADLVAREELLLTPGGKQQLERRLDPATRYVAVIAAFRDLDRAKWRAYVEAPLSKVTPVVVRLQSREVSMSIPRK